MESFLSGCVAQSLIKGAAAKRGAIFLVLFWGLFSVRESSQGAIKCERAGDRRESGNLKGVLPPCLCALCVVHFFQKQGKGKKGEIKEEKARGIETRYRSRGKRAGKRLPYLLKSLAKEEEQAAYTKEEESESHH